MTHILTSNAGRRIGIPVRQAFVLNPGESREITDKQLEELQTNKTARRWLDRSILIIDGSEEALKEVATKTSKKKPQEKEEPAPKLNLPDGITGVGKEYEHHGGGWYSLWINGECATDGKVRKKEAEEMAKDYEV